MGEASGEIIAPPQTQEAKETNFNFGLSVNGSQLTALANLDHLEEFGFAHPAKPNWINKLKILKNRPALLRLNEIKGLVLEGKMQEAKNLLQSGLTLPNQVLDEQKVKEETIDALSKDIPAEEAFKDHLKFNKVFREFIRSLPGKTLYELPKENTRIFLTQLGIEAYVYPKSNTLRLSPGDILLNGRADLPADQQHPFYIEEKEALGESSNDNTISRLEIFTELAKRYSKAFTHTAEIDRLPAIIQSGHFGKDYGYGETRKKGLYAETLTFKDAPKYVEAIQQLKNGNKIIVPWDEINPNREQKLANLASLGYNYPLHELTYINPKAINPIAIFSDQLPQEHKIEGWEIDGAIDIKDKCLVGIWVTPQYKKHLLHWISTWTDEKRQQVFGDRKPEEVLISSVKDLPPLEK